MMSIYSRSLDYCKPLSAFFVTYVRIGLRHLKQIFYSATYDMVQVHYLLSFKISQSFKMCF